MRLSLDLMLVLAVSAGALSAADAPAPATIVEPSPPLRSDGGLGTTDYAPTASEAPFAERTTEKPIDLWGAVAMPKPEGTSDADWAKEQAQAQAARAKMIAAKDYSLDGQAGEYVGWFGIVREIAPDPQAPRTTLLIQHLWSDGLTDLHQQVVSYYGAGDFSAVVAGPAPAIPKLALVHCYGRVAKGTAGVPVLTADYVRVWTWGTFSFMDYGPDKSNPKWVAVRQVAGDDAYDARPDRAFYEKRLGPAE